MSTTLQELKNQIDAANELGVTNITKKGGTISSDATTAEIMAEIDNLPSGGGATTPDFCTEPPLLAEGWNGDTTGLESVELAAQGGTYTYYKVSDKVIPFYYSGASLLTYTCVDQNNEEYSPNAIVSVDGYLILAGAVISAYYDNYTSALWDNTMIAPSSGTWFRKDETRYIKNISFTIEH